MERTILHCDCNNFYASVECLFRPELRGKPLAVAGDPDHRHGIVLAKSYEAKYHGVKTGDPLWLARQRCPGIVFIPPDFELYSRFSQLAKNIYSEYTNRVESYGLDECWLDMTGTTKLSGDGKNAADTIRRRIKSELGITISAGVSFNKVFAKLGSDYKKPDATTVITREGFRQFVWPLPVSALLFVGKATEKVFVRKGVDTIGRLANTPRGIVKSWLGKCGERLWLYANGYDSSPVLQAGEHPPIKSVGNSTTMPRDLISLDQIKIILMVLSESVAARLRQHNLECQTVQISIRSAELSWIERQGKTEMSCCDSTSIYLKALELFVQSQLCGQPVRSLGVRACNLTQHRYIQTSLMPSIQHAQRRENIEYVVDRLRFRFGNEIIRRGVMLSDDRLSVFSPHIEVLP